MTFIIIRGKNMLIGQFLGTSAAEGVPAPFCSCKACEDARRHPENQRMRTSFRIDEKMLIDLGADANVQAMRYGDFTKLEHGLIILRMRHTELLNTGRTTAGFLKVRLHNGKKRELLFFTGWSISADMK